MKQQDQTTGGNTPLHSAGSRPTDQAVVGGDADRLLTFAEGCDFLKMSERWVRERVKDGTLPHVRLGNRIHFRRSALITWCKEQEKGGKP
jgi:excisionase family DNA binding protein